MGITTLKKRKETFVKIFPEDVPTCFLVGKCRMFIQHQYVEYTFKDRDSIIRPHNDATRLLAVSARVPIEVINNNQISIIID